jgi:hypothetical protein
VDFVIKGHLKQGNFGGAKSKQGASDEVRDLYLLQNVMFPTKI